LVLVAVLSIGFYRLQFMALGFHGNTIITGEFVFGTGFTFILGLERLHIVELQFQVNVAQSDNLEFVA
jgi:hypothetical protein